MKTTVKTIKTYALYSVLGLFAITVSLSACGAIVSSVSPEPKKATSEIAAKVTSTPKTETPVAKVPFNAATHLYTTKNHYLVSDSAENLKIATAYWDQNDFAALAIMEEAGHIRQLEPNMKVYAEGVGIYSGIVKIRKPGSTFKGYVLQESIDYYDTILKN